MKNKCRLCEAEIAEDKSFCCPRCKWTWFNRNRTLTPNAIYDCKVCGKHVEKWVAPSRIASGQDTLEYCSRTCAGAGRAGSNHPLWKGGRQADKDGYILIWSPDHPSKNASGYVREHRLVMEKHIGRLLKQTEVVHHKNDNPSDNRIENLELYDSNAKHKSDDNKKRKRDKSGRLLPKR